MQLVCKRADWWGKALALKPLESEQMCQWTTAGILHPVVFVTSLLSLESHGLIYALLQVKSDDVPFPGSTTPGWVCIYNQAGL